MMPRYSTASVEVEVDNTEVRADTVALEVDSTEVRADTAVDMVLQHTAF